MATLLVELNIGYSSSLLVSDKDLVALLGIMERSKQVKRMYSDDKLVIEDKRQIQICTVENKDVLSQTQYDLYIASKAQAEAPKDSEDDSE